jgi:polar amino acid transport system substrate-binding protein
MRLLYCVNNRRNLMRRLMTAAIASSLLFAACGSDKAEDSGAAAGAASDPKACAEGKTLEKGVLTIATGTPAFPPYVIDDKPESGEGFEAAVAMAVAKEMGFEGAAVKWVRTGFDEAIAPGPKTFDFNLQQYTITDERKAAVSFSTGYYTAPQAIVGLADSAAAAAGDIKALKIGVAAGTTSLTYVTDTIKPANAPLVYDDNAAAKAALDGNQIDAIVADLPTALYLAAAELENAKVFGQIEGSGTDQFGLLFAKDNALVSCVDGALAALKSAGELDKITTKWMSEYSEAPMLKLG